MGAFWRLLSGGIFAALLLSSVTSSLLLPGTNKKPRTGFAPFAALMVLFGC
jgi:hypothetical protein